VSTAASQLVSIRVGWYMYVASSKPTLVINPSNEIPAVQKK